MQVDYMVLADAAAAVQGKLYIHGAGWDTLFAASFPVTHPTMSVAIRLRVPWTDTNQPHHLELDIVDDDSQSIVPTPPGPFRGDINVGRPPQLAQGDDQVVPLALNLNGLIFQQAGVYAIILRIDGMEAMRSPFRVKPLQQAVAIP